jgi:hypothetical protein
MAKDPIDFVDWNELKGKEARGVDKGVDLGEIQGIGRNYVITKKGLASKETFYIPKYLAEKYDGKKVYFRVTESQKNEFARSGPPTYEEYSRYREASTPSDIENRIYVVDETPVVVEPSSSTVATVRTVTTVEPTTTASTRTVRASSGVEQEEPPVIDWDRVVHKNVRTMDGEPVGNVVAVLPDSIHVETQGSRSQYLIPKEEVEGFDGAEVTLKAPIADLGQYARPGP